VNLAPLYSSFFVFFVFDSALSLFFCIFLCMLLSFHRCLRWGTLIISTTTVSGRTLGCSSSSSEALEESSESWNPFLFLLSLCLYSFSFAPPSLRSFCAAPSRDAVAAATKSDLSPMTTKRMRRLTSPADDVASFSCHPFLPLFALNFLIDTKIIFYSNFSFLLNGHMPRLKQTRGSKCIFLPRLK